MKFQTDFLMFIDGEFKKSCSNEWIDVINPATGNVLTRIPQATEEDVNNAVLSAKNAFASYSSSSIEYRENLLNKFAEVIEDNTELLAYAETLDTGKPIKDTINFDIPKAAEHFKYFASAIRMLEGTSSILENNLLSLNLYEPYGVVAQIIPWNFPFLIAAWKVAPALAAGNTVVVKPSSSSSLSILVLMDLMKPFLPKGIINVVTGSGSKCGEYLQSNKYINKISFTGSTSVGEKIYASAAEKIIPATLELGGKSANIFFSDCDIDLALDKATLGILFNQGQVCAAGSRIFVQKSFYSQFVPKLISKFKDVKVGDPLDYSTDIGSLISEGHLKNVLQKVNNSLENGARILVGGKRINGNFYRNGCFMEPTLIEATNDMAISQEEVFGPVAVIIPFEDSDDVIKKANDSNYGLAGGVFTSDMDKAIKVSTGIRAGRLWVNTYNRFPVGAKFGGYKKSGLGREMHKDTIKEYSQEKNILISLNRDSTDKN